MKLSHRDLARLAGLWLLERRWAFLAGFEVALPDGVADALAVSKPRDLEVEALVAADKARLADRAEANRQEYVRAREAWNVKAMAWDEANRMVATPATKRPKPPAYPSLPSLSHWQTTPESAKGVVGLVEVKRTRSDLLQDLRKKKLLRYEPFATNLWLAGTREAFRIGEDVAGGGRALVDLKDRGLPSHWGVLLLPTEGNPDKLAHSQVWALRGARRSREALQGELRLRAYQVGRSLSYRALRGDV